VIAFLGRLVTTKGIHLLLEAARLLREQKYAFNPHIIGDGPERARLEQFARDTQIASHERFFGHLDGAELEIELAQASALVVPSLGGEVFGLALAKNMFRVLPHIIRNSYL
jgi:glycosyltransferase involved in cell wall biosynthesis